jgi:hypothetical protein
VARLKLKTKRLSLKTNIGLDKEFYGNIFDKIGIADAICIPTNNFVTKNGLNVMGKGLALQAREKFPDIDKNIGLALSKFGSAPHIVYQVSNTKTRIMTFPTKPNHVIVNKNKSNIVFHARKLYNPKDKAPGYHAISSLSLIEQSAYTIEHITKILQWNYIVIPKVGCGNGNLDWEEEVKPLLQKIGFYKNPRMFFCLGEKE